MALGSAAAHTGTEVIVQIRKETTTPPEWTYWSQFIGPTGTPVKFDLTGTAAANQKIIGIANPTAGNVTIGKQCFIVNTTPASCEKVYVTGIGADA